MMLRSPDVICGNASTATHHVVKAPTAAEAEHVASQASSSLFNLPKPGDCFVEPFLIVALPKLVREVSQKCGGPTNQLAEEGESARCQQRFT